MSRPPIALARRHATDELIRLHKDEHAELVTKYLADKGWAHKEISTHRWVDTTKEAK